MKKLNLIIVLFFSLSSFSQDVNDKIKLFENNLNHWDKSKSKKWSLKERMAFYEVNAVSIAVIKDYKVEWVKAYGYADVSEKKLATTQTLFQAASISKSINSLGVLKLVEEGKLSLDTDINDYLKEWKFPYDSISKGKKISLAKLLSHQAGLSTSGFAGYKRGKDIPTTIEILDGLKPANSQAVRSIFAPDLKFQYSGGGITISQLILENVTGEKYEDYMMKNILTPLEMNNSSYNQPPDKGRENILATAYNAYSKEVKGKFHIYPEKAAAGLWTNPTDLAKYIIETQLSLLGKSNKILSKEMSINRLDNKLGVFTMDFEGVKYFTHSGGNEGFRCNYIGSFENGDGIVIMTNDGSGRIIHDITCSIASMNNWKNFPLELRKESISLAIRKECLKNIKQGIQYYKKLKKDNYNEYNFSDESELNSLAYDFLGNDKIASAFEIFNLNVNEFPNSSNVYDSRGESYFHKKDYLLSKKDYLKSLELDPTNQNAKEMLLKIEKLM
ncbi:serine hydrolase [Flavobacterium sp. ZS1P14]|uniref:serine hydrolase n=1 Tax=Flavobacterium sp. ZS1P14 TaxID=3401729 RepID=UPI003AB03CAB